MINAIFVSIGSGCRTMTPIAVICWAAWLGYLPQTGWAAWVNSPWAVAVFSVCAAGEWVGDILPQTPSRRDPFPLLGRLIFGVLTASLMWKLMLNPWASAVIVGVVGALIGTFGGYRLRVWAAKKAGRDWPIGLAESALVLAVSILMMVDMHDGLAKSAQHMHYL